MGQRLKGFAFHRPPSPSEALRLFHDAPDPVYLAGGTALVPSWTLGERAQAATVISLSACLADRIERGERTLGIGAGTPVARLRGDADRPDALRDALAWFGTTQVRERATVGGNVGLASPGSDLVPPLAAMDAVARFTSVHGDGMLAVGDLFEKPGALALPAGSILLGFELPSATPGTGSAYRRVTTSGVGGQVIASAAVAVAVDAQGRVRRCRATVGTGLPLPATVERFSEDGEADRLLAETIGEFGRTTEPIADLAAGPDYRRDMIAVAITRAFGAARERAVTGR